MTITDYLSVWGAVLSTALATHQLWGAMRQRVKVEFTTQTVCGPDAAGRLVELGVVVVVRLINATAQPIRVTSVCLTSAMRDGGLSVGSIYPCDLTSGWALPQEVKPHDSFAFAIPLKGSIKTLPFDTGTVRAEITSSLGETYKSKRMPKSKAPGSLSAGSALIVNA